MVAQRNYKHHRLHNSIEESRFLQFHIPEYHNYVIGNSSLLVYSQDESDLKKLPEYHKRFHKEEFHILYSLLVKQEHELYKQQPIGN